MPAPAIELVLDALVSRVESVSPTQRPSTKFRRALEATDVQEAPSRASLRQFDVDVLSGVDDSSEGRGVQNIGLADRTVSILISVSYPVPGRAERSLEKVIASDAELILRRVGRAGDWSIHPAAPVRRAAARWAVNRGAVETAGEIVLEITLDVQYRDTE